MPDEQPPIKIEFTSLLKLRSVRAFLVIIPSILFGAGSGNFDRILSAATGLPLDLAQVSNANTETSARADKIESDIGGIKTQMKINGDNIAATMRSTDRIETAINRLVDSNDRLSNWLRRVVEDGYMSAMPLMPSDSVNHTSLSNWPSIVGEAHASEGE